MVRYIKKISNKIGLKPGTPTYIGEHRQDKVVIDIIDYNEDNFNHELSISTDQCLEYRDTETTTWINVTGLHDIPIIEKLGKHFGIHPLMLEDLTNTAHRPKLEISENYIFIIIKMLQLNNEDVIETEQVSLVFGSNWVVSFQEHAGDVFGPVRKRIEKSSPRQRFLNTDYLAYSLLDAVVDNYFLILENLAERIEDVDEELTIEPRQENLKYIHHLKRELIYMRKAVWPLREVISGLERIETDQVNSRTKPYIRDLYEHVIQVVDTVETYRDLVSGLLDIYLSSVSNRMNEVMKVLTIIATIFIPLSFLAGVYGMNFDTSASPFNLPELGFRYGYPLFWLVSLIVGGGLFLFFKSKKWL